MSEFGTTACGDRILAKKPDDDDASDIPTHKCFILPEILGEIFSHMSTNEILKCRLVCQLWNTVVSKIHGNRFEIHFKIDSKRMADFMETTGNTAFGMSLRKFRFSAHRYVKEDRRIYETFFEKFGSNIHSLTLWECHQDLLQLILSDEIQIWLKFINNFKLSVYLSEDMARSTSISFLSNVEHLYVTPSEGNSVLGLLNFLTRFFQEQVKLKSVTIMGFFCVPEFPRDILPLLFKTSTMLEILKVYVIFSPLSEPHIKSITPPPKISKLRELYIEVDRVTPITFHQFLVSHRQFLGRLSLSFINDEQMDVFPTMEELKYLSLGRGKAHAITSNRHIITKLSFCTQAPKLKELDVSFDIGKSHYTTEVFEHTGLESLKMNISMSRNDLYVKVTPKQTESGILALLDKIPKWFPNLSNLEITHKNDFMFPVKSILNLQQTRDNGWSKWKVS